MINEKHADRMVAKVKRLKDVLSAYTVRSLNEQNVLFGGKPIKKGETWGEDFAVGKFTFIYGGGESPYLYIENGGVEHLISVDGKPIGMADHIPGAKDAFLRRHKYISMKDVPVGALVEIESYASHTFFGTQPFEEKQTFAIGEYREKRVYNGIYIAEINETVKAFTEDLTLFASYFVVLKEGDVRRANAYGAAEEMFGILNVTPGTAPDDGELAAASRVMHRFFASLKPNGNDGNLPYVGMIGHSHLDTAWLWPVAETHRKAARTAANAVTMLKRYPSYRFIMSSVVYMDWIKKEHPWLFGEIKKLVEEGRFEPNGATWVECDCNIPDGESIIRHFLRGKRFLKENFNYEADMFWLPDTFGYNAALPQILRGCRVPYFLTSKLSWNDTNRFPYDSFKWKGLDGSEVTVHFVTIGTEGDPELLNYRLENRLNKHITKNLLVPYGFGDGGGGPSAEMIKTAFLTEKSYPYAQAEHTTVSDFMKKLEHGEELPVYDGELYLELHRGTLTTNHNIKQLNRRLENSLKDAELISLSRGEREKVKAVSACWDVLMLNQFHDILPGTCINEVNVQAVAEYKKAIDDLSALTAGESVFNTLWTDRTEILPSENGLQTYTDLDGREVSVDAFSFPAYGYGKRVSENYKSGCFSLSEDGSFKTPFYSGKIKNGSIVSLIFGGREISAGKLNEIKMYADVPLNWDNWDVDPDYELKPCAVTAGESYSVSEGALQLRIRTAFDLGGEGTLTQDTVFNSVDPMIVFESKLEWNGHHRFIKADFDTTVHAKTYRSEIQFGCVERPTTRNNSLEAAKYEVCNHRWTDISEPRFGVALLNREKYGVSVFGGKMGLSLLKSGRHPDTTGDKGTKYFEYALLPHLGGFAAENTVLPAYAFNRRPVYTFADINVPVSGVSAPNVIPETVKFPEEGDGTIVRLYECEGSVSECTVKFRSDSAFYQCDMLEENPVLIGKGRELKLSFGAFEIKTILVKDK